MAGAMDASLHEKEHPDVLARAKCFSVDRAVLQYIELMRVDGV